MTLSVCPAAVARAPVGRVWSLLVDPLAYGTWSDAVVISVTPAGAAHPGQRIVLRAPARGRWFVVRFLIERADDATHTLELTAHFPFGIVLRSRIAATPIDARTSRVQYG